jgi:hypothetical protein
MNKAFLPAKKKKTVIPQCFAELKPKLTHLDPPQGRHCAKHPPKQV